MVDSRKSQKLRLVTNGRSLRRKGWQGQALI